AFLPLQSWVAPFSSSSARTPGTTCELGVRTELDCEDVRTGAVVAARAVVPASRPVMAAAAIIIVFEVIAFSFNREVIRNEMRSRLMPHRWGPNPRTPQTNRNPCGSDHAHLLPCRRSPEAPRPVGRPTDGHVGPQINGGATPGAINLNR